MCIQSAIFAKSFLFGAVMQIVKILKIWNERQYSFAACDFDSASKMLHFQLKYGSEPK